VTYAISAPFCNTRTGPSRRAVTGHKRLLATGAQISRKQSDPLAYMVAFFALREMQHTLAKAFGVE
jgi:hypothetical protein